MERTFQQQFSFVCWDVVLHSLDLQHHLQEDELLALPRLRSSSLLVVLMTETKAWDLAS